MKKRQPRWGLRRWALCSALVATGGIAQTVPAWNPSHSAFGVKTEPSVRATDALGASALARSLGATAASRAANPAAANTTELDLLQAVRTAVAWQPVVKAAVSELQQRGSVVDQRLAGYRPAFSAGLNTGRQSATSTGATMTVSASQMLYDFGKVSSQVSEAEAGVLRARANVLEQIDTVAAQTAQAMVELSRYEALLSIGEQQLTALRDVARITELRANLGASTRVDPVQARARVEALQVSMQQMQTQAKQLRTRLSTLLGAPVPERIAPIPTARLSEALASYADSGLWPSVLMAEAERQAALAQLDGARAARLPTLSLEGTLSRLSGGGRSTDHGVFLKLSSGVFQGGALAAQEEAARMAVEAAQSKVEVARTEVQDRLDSLRARIEGLKALREPLAQRQQVITETRALYREQYLSLGTRSALDLLNAEQEIAQAAQDVVQNRHDLWAAEINYIQSSGQAREFFGLNHTRIHGLEVLP